MTEAQVIKSAARDAVRRYRNSALVGFAILATGIGLAFHTEGQHNADSRKAIVTSGQATAVVGCNRDFVQMQGLRKIIKDGRAQVRLYVAEGTLTETQGERALGESKKALEKQPLPDCRVPIQLLTQDPDDDIKVPEPLYPGKK